MAWSTLEKREVPPYYVPFRVVGTHENAVDYLIKKKNYPKKKSRVKQVHQHNLKVYFESK